MHNYPLYLISSFLFITFCFPIQAQVHHWETAVFAEDDWRYLVGTNEPPSNWFSPLFAPNGWAIGPGGIGYGDDDDHTIIEPTISLYMRHEFTIFDRENIEKIILHADYDDAFVAYLNGIEIARSNIGEVGDHPAHDQVAADYREATMYEGGTPQAFSISTETMQATLRNGPNILAVQVHNQSFDSSDLSALFFLSFGIKDESEMYAPTPDWFNPPVSFLSSNLPLMVINTDGEEIEDEPRITAQMGIIDHGMGHENFWTDAHNHYDGQISIEIRGNSSQSFNKKNYSIETQTNNGENLNVSLLGMPEENDWVLHGPYSDKSLMRNALTFHIGRNMGRYAPRTRYCELKINDEYKGIYVLMEKIKRDPNRVNIAKVKPEDIEGDELTGGYLLKIDWDNGHPDDGFYSSFPPHTFYSYVEPDFDELAPEQESYIHNYIDNFEIAMNDNVFENYQTYIDVEALVDYVISNELGKEVDAYRLSTYMYKKKNSNGGKLHFGPLWDFNLGYGNYDYCPEEPQGWAYQFDVTCGSPLPFWINRLMLVPEIRNTMNCRWFALRENVLHTDTLMQYIDHTAAQLSEAQIRNFSQWGILGHYVWPNSFIGNTYQQEVDFLKTWLNQRLAWMDANMLGDCNAVTVKNVDSGGANVLNVFPNPTKQDIQISIKNHQIQEIMLLDVSGKILFQKSFPQGVSQTSLDVQLVNNGCYFLVAKMENGAVFKEKVLVLK